MRAKHRNDKNHGRNGWVGGNPRYAGKGFKKGDRPADRLAVRRELKPAETRPAVRYKKET
jgi:hypothetical protein